MKKIPNPVPQGHGIYCLVHPKTASLYVGSSTNLRARSHVWNTALKRGHFEYPAEEWEFRVLERTEGLSYTDLRTREMQLIEHARTKKIKLLNTRSPVVSMRFVVDGLDGSPTFHACRLGKSPNGVVDKLKRGYSIEQALEASPSHYNEREATLAAMPIKITLAGNPLTYSEAANTLGCAKSTLKAKIKQYRIENSTVSELPLEVLGYYPPRGSIPIDNDTYLLY